MRVLTLTVLVSLLFGLVTQTFAADAGYEASARWWGEIEASAQRVDAELRELYAEAASDQAAPEGVTRAVDRLLKERYPGGSFTTGQRGRLVFNAGNYAEFSGQKTHTLVARLGDVVRRYELPERRFTVTRGGHFLTAVIHPASPGGSRFVAPVSLPAWMEETAGNIIGRQPTVFGSPFVDLLNRVYDRRLAATGVRLDQLAETLLGGGAPVEQVLSLGRELSAKKP